MDSKFFGDQMQKVLSSAQKMQSQMEEAQRQLDDLKEKVSVGGDKVCVIVNGQRKIISVTISEEALSDRHMLQHLITAAINKALKKIEIARNEKIQSSMAGSIANLM